MQAHVSLASSEPRRPGCNARDSGNKTTKSSDGEVASSTLNPGAAGHFYKLSKRKRHYWYLVITLNLGHIRKVEMFGRSDEFVDVKKEPKKLEFSVQSIQMSLPSVKHVSEVSVINTEGDGSEAMDSIFAFLFM